MWNLYEAVAGWFQTLMKTMGIGAIFVTSMMLCVPVQVQFSAIRLVFTDLGDNKLAGERSYGQSCDFFTPGHPDGEFANFTSALDVFIVAHVLGLFAKTLIIRDMKLLLCISLCWELLELMTKHILPNFEECWWDQIILDFFGCNLAGIILGRLWIKYFD